MPVGQTRLLHASNISWHFRLNYTGKNITWSNRLACKLSEQPLECKSSIRPNPSWRAHSRTYVPVSASRSSNAFSQHSFRSWAKTTQMCCKSKMTSLGHEFREVICRLELLSLRGVREVFVRAAGRSSRAFHHALQTRHRLCHG